ncbi:MAG: cupredoxin domain-containing protein [Methanotrichaceae archaeon]
MIGNNKIIGILLSLMVLAIIAMPVYAAGNATAGNITGNASSNKTVTVNIVAKNIAFNTSTITVPAGAQVTVNFDNQDSGVQHNIAFYTNSSASKPIYVGAITTGPKKITYTFDAPTTPGTYFFRCDVHPSIMTGQFIVK